MRLKIITFITTALLTLSATAQSTQKLTANKTNEYGLI